MSQDDSSHIMMHIYFISSASSATSLLAIADRLQPTSAAELWDADNDDDDELRMFMSRGGSSSNAVATTSGAGTGQSSDTVVYVRVRAIEDERNPLPRKSFKFKVKMVCVCVCRVIEFRRTARTQIWSTQQNDTLERLHSKYVEFTQYPGNIQLLFRGVKILTYVTPASFPRGGRGSDDEALVLGMSCTAQS